MKPTPAFEDVLFRLLRSGLALESESSPTEFPVLSSSEWSKILKISVTQGVVGLLFSGIEHLDSGKRPDKDTLMLWFGHLMAIERYNVKYTKDALELLSAFRENGLIPIVFKGLACASFYPIPRRRALGDLDVFLFNKEGKCAYEEGNNISCKLDMEVDLHDYKHSHIRFRSLMVENHRFCTEIRGANVKKAFEKELQRQLVSCISSGTKKDEAGFAYEDLYPTSQFNALFLMAHAFNHFMDEGVSLRQICDWAMFVKERQNDVDWEHFYYWMKRIEAKRFADCINTIVSMYLHVKLNFNYTAEKELANRIIYNTIYEHKSIHASGLRGCKYRWKQVQIMYHGRWKYSDVCGKCFIIEYIKNVWYYLSERNPSI